MRGLGSSPKRRIDLPLSSLLDDLRLQKEKQHRWDALRQVRAAAASARAQLCFP